MADRIDLVQWRRALSREWPAMRERHFEAEAQLDGDPVRIFAYLDDPRRLAAHMTQASWMMAGARMTLELDALQGRAPGARITLHGRMLGLPLEVTEVVTRYEPPHAKQWETTGSPRLWVIGHYTLGFSLVPLGQMTRLRVTIEYAAPAGRGGALLCRVLGGSYARWCVNRMVRDAARRFTAGREVER